MIAVPSSASTGTPPDGMPRLERSGSATLLMVDGRPLVIRGGELGNSSHDRQYLAQFWPHLDSLGLNAIVAAVTWEAIEPEEGVFDFESVDELLADLREHGLRLVLLWFGSWKNSMSCYVPGWVKRDVDRFPRARDSRGAALEILTPFAAANREADASAFAALMAHLRETDPQHTVVLVQVENEIGMIPEARDRCDLAEAAWAAPVPTELTAYLAEHAGSLEPELADTWAKAGGRAEGTWAQVFGAGPAGQEVFQAWAFAKYTEAVAAAGKAEHPLPMYTNAALIRPGMEPGQYPSAGPLPHLADIWRAGAPSLDFISPDVYFPNFAHWVDRYVAAGQPLFVPEALRSIDAAGNALYAFGKHGAIGFSPFGIETIEPQPAAMLRGAFDVVRQLSPLIAAHAGQGTMTGLLPPADDMRAPQRVRLGDVVVAATYERAPAPSLADGVINESGQAPPAERLPAAAIVIRTGPDELVVAGIGVTLTFHPVEPGETVGILACEEGRFADDGGGTDGWQRIRRLNGDQTHQGRHVRLEPGRFAVQRVRLYRYR